MTRARFHYEEIKMKSVIHGVLLLFVSTLASAEPASSIPQFLALFGNADAFNQRVLYVYSEVELSDIQISTNGTFYNAIPLKKSGKYFAYKSPVTQVAFTGEKLHTVRAKVKNTEVIVTDVFSVAQDPKTFQLSVTAATHVSSDFASVVRPAPAQGVSAIEAKFSEPIDQNFNRYIELTSDVELTNVQVSSGGTFYTSTPTENKDKKFTYRSSFILQPTLGEKIHSVRANVKQSGAFIKEELTVEQEPFSLRFKVTTATHVVRNAELPKHWVENEGIKGGIGEDHDENGLQFVYFTVPELLQKNGEELSLCINGPTYCQLDDGKGSVKHKLNSYADGKQNIFLTADQLGFFQNEYVTLELIDSKHPDNNVYFPFQLSREKDKWVLNATKEQNGLNNPYNFDPLIAPVPSDIALSDDEAQIIRETNRHRQNYGLPLAQINPWLMYHCRQHSIWMNTNGMNHSWVSGRVTKRGQYFPNTTQENVGYAYYSGEEAVKGSTRGVGWIGSPAHNRALLEYGHVLLGAGFYGNGQCVVFDTVNYSFINWISQQEG
jgi:uncharacterized protein YkwD